MQCFVLVTDKNLTLCSLSRSHVIFDVVVVMVFNNSLIYVVSITLLMYAYYVKVKTSMLVL